MFNCAAPHDKPTPKPHKSRFVSLRIGCLLRCDTKVIGILAEEVLPNSSKEYKTFSLESLSFFSINKT